MSLDTYRTMKPIPWDRGEGRWELVKISMPLLQPCDCSGRRKSEDNRCHVLAYRHGGVSGVGMLRSIMGKRGEILTSADAYCKHRQQTLQATLGKGVLAEKEVGGAHSSNEALVMRSGAKGLYLVDVNQEGKDV